MDPQIIVAIIALTPVLLLTLFRSNAAAAFLALALGNLLGNYLVFDVADALRGYVAPNPEMTQVVVALLLLWVPVLLVALFMAGTLSKKQRLWNLLPALGVGLVGVLLTVPFLGQNIQTDILLTDVWRILESNQALIVGLGTMISLVMLRMRKPIGDAGKGKHH